MTLDIDVLSVPKRAFAAHSHDEFVISVNAGSVLEERVRLDGHRFEVAGGGVTTYNPLQIQSSVTRTRDDVPWSCISVSATAADVQELTGRADGEFSSPQSRSPRLARGLRRAAASTGTSAQEWAAWCVAEALASSERRDEADRPRSLLTSAARHYLAQEMHRPVSLAELAGVLGTSAGVLSRAFVQESGVPPYSWQLQLRLLEGRRRLRGGGRIAAVAAELGFTDQAHFHRHYRAAYARTPGADARR